MIGSTDGRPPRTADGWATNYRDLSPQPNEVLSTSDLEQLAVSSYLIGDDDRCLSSWEEAHRRHVAAGDDVAAALCSFWLAFHLMMRGQMAQAGAWIGRAEATIGESGPCPASGYILIPALLRSLDAGHPEGARELAAAAAAIAEEFGDRDLAALARLGDGQALMAMGESDSAGDRFDEAMLGVSTGDVGPVVAGIVYCAVILECMQVFDLARAAEWTSALHAWCEAQPDLVPYRGQCLVHRSQLQQAEGDWPNAIASAATACDRLSDPPHPALGLARYQQAELHRLQGAYDDAAAAYAQASAGGKEPMPGLALLALARGDTDAATAAIRRALHETSPRAERPRLLAAAVEILREARDLDGARRAAEELLDLANDSTSEVLPAMAEQAIGAVLLAEGDPASAMRRLRAARTAWLRLTMPHDAARTSVLLGLGCLSLGDRATAALEFENARATFDAIGAGPDADRLRRLHAEAQGPGPAGLTAASVLSARELEVLGHVAAGKTNPEIAAALSISKHTVRRHLENIFAKLGVSGRAGATAYAYEHHLL